MVVALEQHYGLGARGVGAGAAAGPLRTQDYSEVALRDASYVLRPLLQGLAQAHASRQDREGSAGTATAAASATRQEKADSAGSATGSAAAAARAVAGSWEEEGTAGGAAEGGAADAPKQQQQQAAVLPPQVHRHLLLWWLAYDLERKALGAVGEAAVCVLRHHLDVLAHRPTRLSAVPALRQHLLLLAQAVELVRGCSHLKEIREGMLRTSRWAAELKVSKQAAGRRGSRTVGLRSDVRLQCLDAMLGTLPHEVVWASGERGVWCRCVAAKVYMMGRAHRVGGCWSLMCVHTTMHALP